MEYCWCTIDVADPEESVKFYSGFLGLRQKSRFSPRPGMEIIFLTDGKGSEIELIKPLGNESAGSHRKGISIGFEVPSLDEAVEKAGKLGIPVLEGPFVTPKVKFFFTADPDGTRIQIVEKSIEEGGDR